MNNSRNTRKGSAEQTLQIIENKGYTVNNKRIDLTSAIEYSLENTQVYTAESFDKILSDIEVILAERQYTTKISVKNCTAMEAAQQLIDRGRTGCLNFASAKNPGGGFLGGSQAQEESLARASTLYPTQIKYFKEMYEYNRARNSYLYSDRMIYSPQVTFFKDDDDTLLKEPYQIDILTSPAINIGAMLQNKRMQELEQAEKVMIERIDKILALFVLHGVKNLILGAWGCGVFKNSPENIADYFARYLTQGGKYEMAFETIVFAVYDKSKNLDFFRPFEKVF